MFNFFNTPLYKTCAFRWFRKLDIQSNSQQIYPVDFVYVACKKILNQYPCGIKMKMDKDMHQEISRS